MTILDFNYLHNKDFNFMKQFKNLLFLLIFLSGASINLYSQNYGLGTISDFIDSNNIRKRLGGETEEIIGSPYENDEFIVGYFVSTSNQKYENIPLRVNAYNNEIEYQDEEGTIFVFAIPELIDFVQIENAKYKYYPYSSGKKIFKGYFNVLIEGKASLLSKGRIIFNKAKLPVPYQEAVPATFKKLNDEYFIKIGTSEAKMVSGKKDVLKILDSEDSKIEDFIKKNKIKVNKSEGLIEVVTYYNAL